MDFLTIKIYINIYGNSTQKNLKTIIDYIITKQDLRLKIQAVRPIEDKLWDRSQTISSQNFVSLHAHIYRQTRRKE